MSLNAGTCLSGRWHRTAALMFLQECILFLSQKDDGVPLVGVTKHFKTGERVADLWQKREFFFSVEVNEYGAECATVSVARRERSVHW